MIKVNDIIKSYGNGESRLQVLQGIHLEINDGDFVVILGASGSGKSTLLHVISGLERPDSGEVFYDSTDITVLSDNELTAFRKENIGFIFQQYYLLPNMDVDRNVKMGADLAGNKNYGKLSKPSDLERNYINTQVNFPAANSRGFPLQEHWRKSPGYCSLMNLLAH